MGIRIAVSGFGYIGRHHCRAIRSVPECDLTAVVDTDPNKRKAFVGEFGVDRVYSEIGALISDGTADALVVATPNCFHAPLAIEALRAGVHVMVEKPMAMNASEAQQMLTAAESSGAVLMVAHCWRFDKEVRWLKAQVDSGKLGRILRTKGYGVHVHWGPAGWFTSKTLAGGGALADMGIHAMDTARYLLGDPVPKTVYARIGTYYKDYDVDDTGTIIIGWDNGAYSYIESGWWQPHSDGPEAATQLYGTIGFGQLFPSHLVLPGVGGILEKTAPSFTFPRPEHCPQSMYNDQMAYFAECVAAGRKPVPGGAEGLANMRITDAAYLSASTGKVVELGGTV